MQAGEVVRRAALVGIREKEVFGHGAIVARGLGRAGFTRTVGNTVHGRRRRRVERCRACHSHTEWKPSRAPSRYAQITIKSGRGTWPSDTAATCQGQGANATRWREYAAQSHSRAPAQRGWIGAGRITGRAGQSARFRVPTSRQRSSISSLHCGARFRTSGNGPTSTDSSHWRPSRSAPPGCCPVPERSCQLALHVGFRALTFAAPESGSRC